MSEDNVVEFPTKEEELTEEFPLAKFGYIDNIAAQVFGDDIGFSCSPAKTPEGEHVVVMYVGSIHNEQIVRKAVFDLKEMSETRKACIVLAYEVYVMEQQLEAADKNKLLIPKSKLIIPGG